MRNLLFCVLACLVCNQTVLSQPAAIGENRSFPYHLNNYREAGLMALGTGILYAGGYSQRLIKPLNESDITALNPSDIPIFERWVSRQWNPRLNRTREFLEPSAIIGAFGTIGGVGLFEKTTNYSWYPLMTLTIMYFEGFYLAQGTMLVAKSVFKRPRPYTYNPELPIESKLSPGNNESYFSGNAAVLFFNATFISQIFTDIYQGKNWLPYLWVGTHGLSLISGIWSVQSGMHFPTDVLTGAIWGSGIAYLITLLHKDPDQRLRLTPWVNNHQKGVTISLSL